MTRSELIAVIAEPPEVYPGETANWTAVFAVPRGLVESPGVAEWSYCTKPRMPGSTGTAPASCLDQDYTTFARNTLTVQGNLPADGCRNFGPEPPVADFRAQDPDETGGYYQPVRLTAEDGLSFHFQRLRCRLGNASTTVARQFTEQYQANRNPGPARLAMASAGVRLERSITEGASAARVEWQAERVPAAPFDLELTWNVDPRESYVRYSALSDTLERIDEQLSLSWYTNSGTLGAEPLRRHGKQWVASALWSPAGGAEAATTWVVIRDARGGSAVVSFEVAVARVTEPSAP